MFVKFLIFMIVVFLQDASDRYFNENIEPGLNATELSGIVKADIPAHFKPDGQWLINKEIYGLKGSWAYTFINQKLDWYLWTCYNDSLDNENFLKSLQCARNIITELEGIYGSPDSIFRGDSVFRDPYESWHWGYDVVNAYWHVAEMEIKAGFKFFGGKGEFHFIVSAGFYKIGEE